MDHPRQHGAEAGLEGWLGRGREAAVCAAVEAFREGEDLVLVRAVVVVGVLAGQLDGGLDALGARVAEKDLVEVRGVREHRGDRKSTRLNSSHANISYAVFCLKKKIPHVIFRHS